jgi:hypothetical protein
MKPAGTPWHSIPDVPLVAGVGVILMSGCFLAHENADDDRMTTPDADAAVADPPPAPAPDPDPPGHDICPPEPSPDAVETG